MAKVVEFPTSAEIHLDTDTLAAFIERALLEREVMAVFAHLADCEHCRERLRVQAQLRSLGEAQLPAVSRQSAWFPASPFRTAAGLVCAVLSGAMLLWWGHGLRQPVSLSTANTNHLPEKVSPISRTPLSPGSVPAQGEGRFPAIMPAQNEKLGLTAEIVPDTQASSRRIGRLRWLQETRSAGQSSSSDSVRQPKQKEQTVAYSLPRSGNLWRTVRFQTTASHLTFRSEPTATSLPGPFVTARLNQQMNFGPISRNEGEENQMQGGCSIAIRTALGERRFYWNGFADKSVVNQ